jgi:ABC-type glycerol-3-phosphate transport system substrate-binding protein
MAMKHYKKCMWKRIALFAAVLYLAGCGAATQTPTATTDEKTTYETFESQDYFVVIAKAGDTAESLAARFLGDKSLAWMIEDYSGGAAIAIITVLLLAVLSVLYVRRLFAQDEAVV